MEPYFTINVTFSTANFVIMICPRGVNKSVDAITAQCENEDVFCLVYNPSFQ